MPSLIPTTAVLVAICAASLSSAAIAHDRDDHRDGYRDRGGHGWNDDRAYRNDRRYYGYQNQGGNRGYYANQGYYDQGYGGRYEQRPVAYGYNQDQRYRCRNGSTGTILGAIAGGLIGNSVAGRGDRTLGTVLGGGAGALVGNSIDKNNRRC